MTQLHSNPAPYTYKYIKLNIHVLSLINTVYIISYETFAYVHTKMYITTTYIINKLVELHVAQLFFFNWDGWGLYGLPVPVLLKVSTQYSVVDLCLGLSGCRCVNEAVNKM